MRLSSCTEAASQGATQALNQTDEVLANAQIARELDLTLRRHGVWTLGTCALNIVAAHCLAGRIAWLTINGKLRRFGERLSKIASSAS